MVDHAENLPIKYHDQKFSIKVDFSGKMLSIEKCKKLPFLGNLIYNINFSTKFQCWISYVRFFPSLIIIAPSDNRNIEYVTGNLEQLLFEKGTFYDPLVFKDRNFLEISLSVS